MAVKHNRKGGVDLVPSKSAEVPYCLHGPTLLFKRFYSEIGKPHQRFFACAAYRSRKVCSFYHSADDQLTAERRERYMKAYTEYQNTLQSRCIAEAATRLSLMKREERCVCETCGLLLVDGEIESVHRKDQGHRIRRGLKDDELASPTLLLSPQEDNRGQAQYFFSSKSQNLLLSEILRLKKTHVICLGVPRLHEDLVKAGRVCSFLLDIDHRFTQFYSDNVFQRFNMFNGFFYSERGPHYLKDFLSTSHSRNVLLVIDPPFGGLLTGLKTGVDKIWSIAETDIHTLLVFPYFNESHVMESFPSFIMLDYQVTYEDHRHFNEVRAKKRPSPVRIYTNLPLPGLQLPQEDGYRLCSVCNRYVHRNNAHCEKCGRCTSKDGRPYNHCDVCSICVKQSHVHCDKCGVCALPNHDCDNRPKPQGCHICGAMDHKRKECPNKSPKKKRKRSFSISSNSRRKRIKNK